MTTTSRGPLTKTRDIKKRKTGTAHQKNHRFESFAQRILKLKVEPVRRGRSTILDDAELDASFSYFKSSLEEWRDLNISENFAAFARKVARLCESLPQIVHHSDKILDLLVEYLDKGDRWSAEPLLSLTAHFAHDLGVRFEKYFERVVKTVSQLAAKNPDVEVIEWSFTCLAWLFKYLSRLLVPDLRPVFDLMAPLLGAEHQKAFVTRFAAESLSFLVRKAGAQYHKNKEPLRVIIKHISDHLSKLQGTGKDYEFQQGLMSLFGDSMKGVQRGLHSSAEAILQELLLQTYDEEHSALRTAPLEPILIGVVTSLIHHTEAQTFKPLLALIVKQAKETASTIRFTGLSARLLFTVCGVRYGDRVEDWKSVLELLRLLVDTVSNASTTDVSDKQDLLSASAVIFQYSPLDVAIPHVQILDKFTSGQWQALFLSFCDVFAQIGAEKFNTLLLPYFKKFVTQKADDYGTELCTVLPAIERNAALPRGQIQPTKKWSADAVKTFKSLTEASTTQKPEEQEQMAYKCNAMLEASKIFGLPADTKEKITAYLFKALENAALVKDAKDARPTDILAAGNGFFFLIQDGKLQEKLAGLWNSLCQVSEIYGHSVLFWEALLALAEGQKKSKQALDFTGPHKESLYRALMRCLSSSSHGMRLAALGLIELIASQKEEVQKSIATARMVEDTPLNMDNARAISMRVRQLAKSYPTICTDEWAAEAIPTYCFGIMHFKLASVRDDATAALKEMCETKEGEAIITRIAFEWVNDSVDETPAFAEEDLSTGHQYANEFQCTNVMQLEEVISKKRAVAENAEERLKSMFHWLHAQLPFVTYFNRTQALVLLNTIPQVAEKKSRLLVPMLLRWGLDQPVLETSEDEHLDSEPTESAGARWDRKDQKALLNLFSKFGNPKVLYRSSEVYHALLVLLTNGDVEIQKSALTAILTWKNPAVVRYKENLFNLLDDARFREEISVFMDVGEEATQLREEHRDELLPVILRLMYGKIINGKKGQEAKRKAVFIALTRFEADAIRQFLSIALGPLAGISIIQEGRIDEEVLGKDLMAPRKRLGMLNMLEDMLSTLKATLTPFTSFVVDPLLYCLIKTSRDLHTAITTPESGEDANHQVSLLRTVRQRAFHSLNILFESCPEFAWSQYASAIVKELVTPRLQQFPVETAQSVSGLLRLFAAWAKSLHTASYLVDYDADVISKAVEVLDVPSAKDEVKIYVLDNVVRSLIAIASANAASTEDKIQRDRIQSNVIQPYSNTILRCIGDVLRKSPGKELLESGVNTVAELAPRITGSAEARSMIEISTFLLKQPVRRVSPQTKLGLLKILHAFIPRADTKDLDELFSDVYDASCSLFSYFRDRPSRAVLCDIMQDLAEYNDQLEPIAKLCQDLNAFSTSRLDEPDFDRRSSAYAMITQEGGPSFSLMQWTPLVYNMLYYIKDNDELSIRVNASLGLRRFIDASASDEAFKPFLASTLMTGLQNGMREVSELVRTEFLAVLAHLVKTHPEWAPVADMQVLLGADEEASFFANILHIQGHRRLRALRRLATQAAELQYGNIYHILLPLLEHFIFNKSEDENAHNLAGEAIRAVTAVSQWLEWPQFRSMLKRFIGYLTSKEDMQKTIIKLLGGMMDSLNDAGRAKGYITAAMMKGKPAPSEEVDGEDAEVEGAAAEKADEDAMDVDTPLSTLTKTLPAQEKLTTDVVNNLLPPLTAFLHNKDESTVSLRVPIAVAVTKVLMVLPPQEIENRLPSVLLDICHILKSKSQDARDMARNTLADIAMLTGSTYLGFILKSLRTALQRGSQLHVLSFTLHHIFVKLGPEIKPGDLDYCLTEIVDVIMDDIFGVTGQEKDAEEYISKMREVKSSKSYDSMDLMARSVTPSHLVDLILPIKSLLLEQLNAKMVNKIDELLRRIGLGVLQNPTVKDRDILVFCYELIQDVYKSGVKPKGKEEDRKNRRYLVNMKGAAKSGARGSTSSYIHKITRFSLDILRTVLRKHEELQTPQNLAGFLPIMGDALIQGQEEVQISAIRLLTTILKVRMPALDENCPTYVNQAVLVIKGAPSTNTELAQASLKLISGILRDRPNVTVKERDIAQLLKRLLPDLDQPDRQGVAFGFIKAIMQRKIVIAEVYEVMDKLATMMVTNHTRSARDLARSSYFHFLMEYPQAKNRFNKQIEFLIRNLRYDHIEGRQSVMEALNLILTKVGDDVLQDVLVMMFIPLIHSMANDDSADCRTMAGALVSKVFERADSQRLKSFTSDLRTWLEQDEDTGLKRLGIQCWGLYLEAAEAKPKEVDFVLKQLQSIVEQGLVRREEDDWELIYYSLTVFSKMCKASPETTISSKRQNFWSAIRTCVSYPHAWVKLTAAKLLGTSFADLASTNGEAGLGNLPLEGSQGLQLTEENMIQLTNAFIKNLSIPAVTEDLCAQSVRNLAFLARCLGANGATWDWHKVDDDEEIEDMAANGDAASDDEAEAQADDASQKKSVVKPPTAIHRLMTRLSGLIRRETKIMKLSSLYAKTATMTLLETLSIKLPIDTLLTALPHLLTTLSTLTDPATTIPRSTDESFNETYKALIDKAREVMSVLQKRMGTTEYLAVMGEVQKGVKQRREERRTKRKVEAVTMPERHAVEKRRRHEVQKVKRKERSRENQGLRRGW